MSSLTVSRCLRLALGLSAQKLSYRVYKLAKIEELAFKPTSTGTPDYESKAASVQVVCAGHPRTGTTSLKKALEILYNQPCYHMAVAFKNRSQVLAWNKICTAYQANEPVHEDLRKVLEGYASCAEFPASLMWEELLKINPDAKVVLTLRSPESWYKVTSRCRTPPPRRWDPARLQPANRPYSQQTTYSSSLECRSGVGTVRPGPVAQETHTAAPSPASHRTRGACPLDIVS